MLFLLVFNYQLIKIINNDCYLPNYNLKFGADELINIQISCSNDQIQEINLIDYPNIESISIHNESNVVISCFQSNGKTQQLYFNIFGRPKISFNNSCHFASIKIYDSPSFNLMQNSSFFVDSLILYNNEYQFPFPFKYVHYLQDDINKIELSSWDYEEIDYFNLTCKYNLTFILDCYKTIAQCDYYDKMHIYYNNLDDHSFRYQGTTINIINKFLDETKLPEYLKLITDSIIYLDSFGDIDESQTKFVNFSNFYDTTNFSSFIDLFPVNTKFFAKLSEKYDTWCENNNINNEGNLKMLLDFGWKPICLSKEPYLHYVLTNTTYEVQFFKKKAFIILISLTTVCAVAFIALLFLIACCRFSSQKKKVGNENLNKFEHNL